MSESQFVNNDSSSKSGISTSVNKKCLIFLCTYNGEKYLSKQLDSVLGQEGVETYISVTDDCSIDSTISILEEYKNKYPTRIFYSINDHNKKFAYNFLDNMFSSKNTDYDYYAFCDQDDVWEKNKILSAINLILNNPSENGTLYCSNLKVVDEDLNYLGMQENESIIKKTNKITFLFENIATGCTIVMDNKFYHHCISYYPKDIKCHDYWVFMVAAYTARFVYDINGYILYRQHGSNQIGSKVQKKKHPFKKISKFFKAKTFHDVLARELINGFDEYLNIEDRKNLITLRDYKKKLRCKLKIIFSRKYRKRRHNLSLKIKILFNKI